MSLSWVPIFPIRSSTIEAPLTRDTSIANMHNLYLTSHRIPVVALSEEYFVPFPSYLDNKSYQRVAENEMHMHNHDFNVTAELVCSDLFFFLNANSLAFIFFNASFLPPLLQAVTAIRNIAYQHRKLYLRLDNAKQLRRYAQSDVSKHNALDNALGKARAKSRHWERKAKESTERAMSVENERDKAKEEARIVQLVVVAAGDVKPRAKDDLDRVRDALAVAEES